MALAQKTAGKCTAATLSSSKPAASYDHRSRSMMAMSLYMKDALPPHNWGQFVRDVSIADPGGMFAGAAWQ
jgi:hypothetical protein